MRNMFMCFSPLNKNYSPKIMTVTSLGSYFKTKLKIPIIRLNIIIIKRNKLKN